MQGHPLRSFALTSFGILIAALSALPSACAPTGDLTKHSYHLPVDHAHFQPIGLYINRHSPVTPFDVARVTATELALKETGAFADIGSNVNSDYYLDVTLRNHAKGGAADLAKTLVSASTLFLVPSKVHNSKALTVDIFFRAHKIKTYRYTSDYDSTMGLTSDDLTLDPRRYDDQASRNRDEFACIHNLVNQFVRDLDRDNLLPRQK